MPNTRSIAAHEPWSDDEGSKEREGEKYFAVLALDGDSMGTWISGSKTPEMKKVLSPECAKAYEDAGANLGNRRPLSPSWHLQFSEALGNFSQHAARRIVEAFDGRLIYSGGDDVLAMLPADTALDCAHALRLAFVGNPQLNEAALGILQGTNEKRRSDRSTALFQIQTRGFLLLTPAASSRHRDTGGLLDDPVSFPAIVPGPAADCSVGIAVAHFKAPLQDVVRAAQHAEKRAKTQLGRGAIAISLFKRSGEIVEWGCKWDEGGLLAYRCMMDALVDGVISAKFPHRVIELVTGYRTDLHGTLGRTKPAEGFDDVTREILAREISTAIERQRGAHYSAAQCENLQKAMLDYLDAPSLADANHKTSALMGLCHTVAFIARNLA